MTGGEHSTQRSDSENHQPLAHSCYDRLHLHGNHIGEIDNRRNLWHASVTARTRNAWAVMKFSFQRHSGPEIQLAHENYSARTVVTTAVALLATYNTNRVLDDDPFYVLITP